MTTLVEPSPTQIYAVLEFVLQTKVMKVMTRKGPGIFCWLNFCDGKCSAWWILTVESLKKCSLSCRREAMLLFGGQSQHHVSQPYFGSIELLAVEIYPFSHNRGSAKLT